MPFAPELLDFMGLEWLSLNAYGIALGKCQPQNKF